MDFDALHREFLIDLNGDGKPDAVVRGAGLPDYGLGPMTPASRSGRPNAELRQGPPTTGERAVNALLDYGPMPAKMFVEQAEAAGHSTGRAIEDPSLVNVVDAGARNALLLGRPLAAMGILGGGYAATGAQDLGLTPAGPALAQSRKQQPAPGGQDLPGLTPEQNAEYRSSVAAIKSGGFASGAERRYHEGIISRYGQISSDFVSAHNAAAGEEYKRAVLKAETMRDDALAKDRRFSDTKTGKLFEQTGGLTPVLAGAGAGFATRWASGPGVSQAGKIIKDYVMPAATGAIAGATVANAPVYYNAYQTEPDNPAKRAYEAYARELPPSHPRKAEFAELARGLPEDNPIATESKREFKDGLVNRLFAGGLEGAGGGLVGAEIVRIPGRGIDWIRSPGGSGGGPQGGGGPGTGGGPSVPRQPSPQESPPTSPGGGPSGSPPSWGPFPTYPSLPPSVRDKVAEAYLVDRIISGRPLPPKAGSEAIKDVVKAPVTPQRIRETNAVVDAFARTNGRPPTRAEFNTLRHAGTLGIATAAGGGAINALMQDYADSLAPY